MHTPPSIDVLFVCLHGSAKSVVAAAYFRRLAAERGLDLSAASAGLEPDTEVSAPTIAGLTADGFERPTLHPQLVTGALLSFSCVVVSFGCDLGPFGLERPAIDWSDVPAISDGYAESRDVIVPRVAALLDQVATKRIVPS